MPDLKISELPSATTPLAGTEVVPIVQGGTTKKVSVINIGGWTTVIKAADETRTSTTTLTADDTLDIALDASSTYIFRMIVFLSAHTTPDSKYDLEYTGTTTSQYIYAANTQYGGSVSNTNLSSYTVESIPTSMSLVGTTSATLTIFLHGVINTNTSGTFRFRWAQNGSSSENVTVRKGSHIEYRKV
jgi:hypothetical protein